MNKFLWKIGTEEPTCDSYLSGVLKGHSNHVFRPESDHSYFEEPTETVLTKKVFDTELFQLLIEREV